MTHKLPRFLPWVGSRFHESSPRVLVLGESHWAEPNDDVPTITQDFVKHYALEVRFAFTTKVARLVGQVDPAEWLSNERRADIWQSIAFYNYVQRIVASTARVPPSASDWISSAPAFTTVLAELRPHIVFALGQRLWTGIIPVLRLQEQQQPVLHSMIESSGVAIPLVHLKHPAGRGFRYSEQQERVRAARQLLAPHTPSTSWH